MYVFFVTLMIWFAACLFRWERDQRTSSLLLALIVWLLALHFHQLAVLAAPLFLYPGLSRQSWRQVMLGGATLAIGAAIFYAYRQWIKGNYPDTFERPPTPVDPVTESTASLAWSGHDWFVAIGTLLILVSTVALATRTIRSGGVNRCIPITAVGGGLIALALLHYHVGGLLLLFGTVFWLRNGGLPRAWLFGALALGAIITVGHLVLLHGTGLYPGRKIVGALIGVPSIWPTLRFFEYAPLAAVLFVLTFAYILFEFARNRRMPVHVLFFIVAVWAPLILLGALTWYMPPRYAQGQLGFFLLCVFAGLVYVAMRRGLATENERLSWPGAAAAVIVAALIVNPAALKSAVSPAYGYYPDHKGAAEFIKGLNLGDDAVLIAEDILQQTYYLDFVDYSLRPADDAAMFSFVKDGVIVDQYTGVPVIGSGEELLRVFDKYSESNLYIIGSGENFVAGKRLLRGQGIDRALQSARLSVVYEGRDGKTKIWKLRQ